MTNPMPQLVSLTPIVLTPDRVLLNLETTNFVKSSNLFLDFDQMEDTPNPEPEDAPRLDPTEEQSRLAIEDAIQNSPYPNVELLILDPDGHEVAQLFIVEHKEEQISMTMHLRRPRLGETYTARAEMTHARKRLQTLDTPFQLQTNDGEPV